ncbi:MAG: DUF1292 domain-containing protein [Ruminococcus sp.]|nr:DUF1292 domain-containing protein [Ruminococcus sp.]MBR6647109.1 DUF1292 domain-containing protein [Clostridia bacterium]
MSNEYSPDLITLVDEEDVEHNFEILDTIEYEGKEYLALYPVFDNPEDMVTDSGEYYIMEAQESEDGWELAEVQDDELIDKLADIFEERFADKFDEE